MSEPESLYDLLGVRPDAKVVDIKKAYRSKAVLAHPDKTTHPRAHVRFQRLSEAAAILTDPVQRDKYDREGETAVIKGSNTYDIDRAESVFKQFTDELNPDEIDEDDRGIVKLLDHWSDPNTMKASINETLQLDEGADYFHLVDLFLEHGRLTHLKMVGNDHR